MELSELINLITNNGMGIACVIYTLYVNMIIMNKMNDNLLKINDRLMKIENDMDDVERYVKG